MPNTMVWFVFQICVVSILTVFAVEAVNVKGPSFNSTSSSRLSTSALPNVQCDLVAGQRLISRKHELECCNETERLYRSYWNSKAASLAKYLNKLKRWNCPQFENECEQRTFSFNTVFTTLMYDRFCSPIKLAEKCLHVLSAMAIDPTEKKSNLSFSLEQDQADEESNASRSNKLETKWTIVAATMRNAQLSQDDLTSPCLQVALYQEGIKYHELKSVDIPSCELFWCGFDEKTAALHQVSAWTCLHTR